MTLQNHSKGYIATDVFNINPFTKQEKSEPKLCMPFKKKSMEDILISHNLTLCIMYSKNYEYL